MSHDAAVVAAAVAAAALLRPIASWIFMISSMRTVRALRSDASPSPLAAACAAAAFWGVERLRIEEGLSSEKANPKPCFVARVCEDILAPDRDEFFFFSLISHFLSPAFSGDFSPSPCG